MNKLGMCMNWKVLAGVGVVGLGVWVVAPNLVGAALPLLFVLACPISMMLMMRGMNGSQCASQGAPAQAAMTLEARLADLRAQREAVTREIAELEAANRETGAERGARSAMPQARV